MLKKQKQAITIYINMHGTDDIYEDLINTLPPDFTHTFVSTIGKLGCCNVDKYAYKDDKEYCEKINEYKDIFQGKTICESNNFLAESDVKNVYENTEENKQAIDMLRKEYKSNAECAIKYHQDYIPSANKTRVLEHERIYSCCDEVFDEHYNPALVDFEKKYMGIFVIETYNVDNPVINEIFDELKSRDSNCRLVNLCRYAIIKHICNTLINEEHKRPELNIKSILDDITDFDVPFHPLFNETEFETVHTQNRTDPKPEYDETGYSFIEIYNHDLDRLNNYKIKEITLSDILRLFFILEFKHVNIIDKSCRVIEGEACDKGNYPNFMKPDTRKNRLVRSISIGEKERGRDFLTSNPELGGKRIKKSRKSNKRKRNSKRNRNRKSKRNNKSKKIKV